MKVNVNLLFYLKKIKNYESGSVPIYLRLTIAGKRAEVSTGRECEPQRWNAAAGRASGTTEAIKLLNRYLDSLQAKVYEAQYQLDLEGVSINVERLKRKLTGKEERAKYLIEIFTEHNRKMATLVGDEFAPGTLERYTTSLKHTLDFLQLKYQVSDIDIRKVDHAFITEYEFYLRSVRKCSNNTAVKYIKNFGKIIRI
jgi:hypothetical protein